MQIEKGRLIAGGLNAEVARRAAEDKALYLAEPKMTPDEVRHIERVLFTGKEFDAAARLGPTVRESFEHRAVERAGFHWGRFSETRADLRYEARVEQEMKAARAGEPVHVPDGPLAVTEAGRLLDKARRHRDKTAEKKARKALNEAAVQRVRFQRQQGQSLRQLSRGGGLAAAIRRFFGL